MNDQVKRAALVTGGTSGIGRAVVSGLVAAGIDVAFTGRDETAGNEIMRELGDQTFFIRADAANIQDVEMSVDMARERWGRLDILFNNAGGPVLGGPVDITPEQFQLAMDLLLRSVVFYMRFAAPYMAENQWGRIINNSSVAALRSDLGGYIYSVAKAGVSHASRLAARELGSKGITVNTVSPGAIATPVFYGGSRIARSTDPEKEAARSAKLRRNLASATPVGDTGLPEDIANAVVYLASEEARFVNGVDLVVDGGMTIGGRSDYGIR